MAGNKPHSGGLVVSYSSKGENISVVLSGDRNNPLELRHSGGSAITTGSFAQHIISTTSYGDPFLSIVKNRDGNSGDVITGKDISGAIETIRAKIKDVTLGEPLRMAYAKMLEEAPQIIANLREEKRKQGDKKLEEIEREREQVLKKNPNADTTKFDDRSQAVYKDVAAFEDATDPFIQTLKDKHTYVLEQEGYNFIFAIYDREMSRTDNRQNLVSRDLPKSVIPFNSTVQDVQALLRLSGAYSGAINGFSDAKLKKAMKDYLEANHITDASAQNIKGFKKLLMERLGEDENFAERVYASAKKAAETNSSTDDVKSLQVYLNLAQYKGHNNSVLTVDGQGRLRSGGISNTMTAWNALESDMRDYAMQNKIDENMHIFKKQEIDLTVSSPSHKLIVPANPVIPVSHMKPGVPQMLASKAVELATQKEQVFAKDRDGTRFVSNIFNSVTTGALDDKTAKRSVGFLQRQFESVDAYAQAKGGPLAAPHAGDLLFMRDKVCVVTQVDENNYVHVTGPGDDGKATDMLYPLESFKDPNFCKAMGIVGIGDTTRLLQNKVNDIALKPPEDNQPVATLTAKPPVTFNN